MIAAWMLYCSAVGLLLLLAAVPVERALHDAGAATRRVWATALGGTVLLPVVAVLVKDAPPVIEIGGDTFVVSETARTVAEGVNVLALFDGVLGGVWLLASVVLAALLATTMIRTHLRISGLPRQAVDGVEVLVCDDTGPAVFGVWRPTIVVPRWALTLPERERSMMIRHEQEHVRALDPQLLLFGLAIAVVTPWNPAVWIMLRRLRLAIEVDCDRRVLRGEELSLRRYAELLIAVGSMRGSAPFAVGFSVGRPFLEQRIDRMTQPRGPRRTVHGLLVLAGVVGILAAAWSIPQPIRASKVDHELASCPNDTARVSQGLLDASESAT